MLKSSKGVIIHEKRIEIKRSSVSAQNRKTIQTQAIYVRLSFLMRWLIGPELSLMDFRRPCKLFRHRWKMADSRLRHKCSTSCH